MCYGVASAKLHKNVHLVHFLAEAKREEEKGWNGDRGKRSAFISFVFVRIFTTVVVFV